MGSLEEKQQQLPTIDFSALDPSVSNPNTQEWDGARSKLVQALGTYGCFEAIYDRVSPELRRDLFEEAMPELFELPLDVKLRNSSDVPFMGYVGQIRGMAYESLRVGASEKGVQEFAHLMWPEGNPDFCSITSTYAKHLYELAKMVHRMLLESFGLGKYYDSPIEPKTTLRLSEYGAPSDQITKVAMASHLDSSLLTIICQHKIEGLEVQTKEGEWIHVVPLPNSFTVMIGEAFTAWTNGRFQAPWHRVKLIGDDKRYSVLFITQPSDDHMFQPLEELADDDHPLRFKPFNYNEYMKFRFSEEGRKCKNTLEAFCGLGSGSRSMHE